MILCVDSEKSVVLQIKGDPLAWLDEKEHEKSCAALLP